VRGAKGVYSFGRELRSCQLDGIRISETLMPAGLRLGEHSHQPGQICFVLEGDYRERAGGDEHCLRAGSVQFHAPGERHSNLFSAETDVLTLLISIEPRRWKRVAASRPIAPGAMLRNCAFEIRRELKQADEAARAALEAWSLLSLSILARAGYSAPKQEPEWITEAISFIARHLNEPITLSKTAEAVGVHRATLAAGFRHLHNCSVGEWIRERRIDVVRQLLATTRKPLAEIAAQMGFYDQAHMNRIFRRAVGTSPGAYRSRRV
jgi:AraC-like DNA-binding protein/quercetin dioxygenase-like cupin family protein